MTIRKAVASDMKAVLALVKELATFENQPEAVWVTESDLVADGFGNQPLFNCFVAEVEGNIVGIALYYYRYSTWKGKTIHLEDLIVTQAYRGTGLGKALYTKVMQQAYNENLRRVEWEVLEWNTNAIAFYQSTGAILMEEWKIARMEQQALKQFVENKS